MMMAPHCICLCLPIRVFFVKKVDDSFIVLKVSLGCVVILFDRRKSSVVAHEGKDSTLCTVGIIMANIKALGNVATHDFNTISTSSHQFP